MECKQSRGRKQQKKPAGDSGNPGHISGNSKHISGDPRRSLQGTSWSSKASNLHHQGQSALPSGTSLPQSQPNLTFGKHQRGK